MRTSEHVLSGRYAAGYFCAECTRYFDNESDHDMVLRIITLEGELQRYKEALKIAEDDSKLLTGIIEESNNGDSILDEDIWDDLPGASENMQQEVRAALRNKLAAIQAAKEQGE